MILKTENYESYGVGQQNDDRNMRKHNRQPTVATAAGHQSLSTFLSELVEPFFLSVAGGVEASFEGEVAEVAVGAARVVAEVVRVTAVGQLLHRQVLNVPLPVPAEESVTSVCLMEQCTLSHVGSEVFPY